MAETGAGKLAERRRIWREHVRAWQASGLGVTAYARKHDLNPKTFLYWRQSLRRNERKSADRLSATANATQPLFRRLDVVTPPLPVTSSEGGCRLRLPNGALLELDHLPDADALVRLVAAAGVLSAVGAGDAP